MKEYAIEIVMYVFWNNPRPMEEKYIVRIYLLDKLFC
jgi:hypothetical protein